MITIRYKKDDLRYIFLMGDGEELRDLEHFLNKIPDYQFLPSYSGVPKPEVFLNKFKTKDDRTVYWCHSGLYKTIWDWCQENNIQCEGIDNNLKYTGFKMSLEEFTDYIKKWNLNLDPRDYQVKAAWLILHYRCSCSQLCTRAGKTLIFYIIARYLLENGCKNVLMVVPSIQLVKQGVQDLNDYKEFFGTETVWAKGEYCEGSNLTIGTFQSLVKRADKRSVKYDPTWFNKFDVVVVDEAHHLVCKSINTIMALQFMKNVFLRFGFTGTMPKEDTIDSFCCHSLMGPTIQDLTSHELIDDGVLAKPIIHQVRINYPGTPELTKEYIRCGEYLCGNDKVIDGKKVLLPKDQQDFTMKYEKTLPYAIKECRKLYDDQEYMSYLVDLCKGKGANLLMLEQMIIHRSSRRLGVMKQILFGLDKNVIVFGHHTAYLKYLRDEFVQAFPDRLVRYIDGSVPVKKREQIVQEMNDNNNVILVASYSCVGTGITFKNVDYGIFAQSFKSEIINRQSIGRLMLKTNEKDKFYIYDLIDKLPTKRLYMQGIAKIKTYKQQQFEYHIEEV